MKKKLNFLVVLVYLLPMITLSQTGTYMTIPPSSGKVKVLPKTTFQIEGTLPKHPLDEGNFSQEIDETKPLEELPVKSGIAVNIGRNFGANNMADGTPMDNTIAISNGGFIVSADNRQVDYYSENGDTIKQFVFEYADLYSLSGFTLDNVFDPRVIYDRYNDRFILAAVDHSEDTRSCIYLSFSKNNTPSDSASWNHYKLPIDSTHFDPTKIYWYDYINIAVNKDELFITSNVFEYIPGVGNTDGGNALWQINKQEGYDSLDLVCRKFTDITQTNSDTAFTLVPLSESLQSDSYNKGCYLVNSKYDYGDSLYWYYLDGNITDTSATISKYSLHTTNYQYVPYSSQPGGNAGDRLRHVDCRVQSGYYQNGKLHFVYVRNNLDWGQIVYSRINITTNTEERNTWGIVNKNYLYPSIASFSNDTLTEDAMICFNRVGPSEYPQVCVVNYQAGWSPNSTVIKDGDGLLDLRLYDSTSNTYERWGDYTGIQRRYNQQACWLVGSYAFGDTTNLATSFTNGLNAWIAEIGEKDVSLEEQDLPKLKIYPNPSTQNQGFYINGFQAENIQKVYITDPLGKQIPFERTNNQIQLKTTNSGLFFITIKTNQNETHTSKILVH